MKQRVVSLLCLALLAVMLAPLPGITPPARALTISVDGNPGEWNPGGWAMDAPSAGSNIGHIGRDPSENGQYIWSDAVGDPRGEGDDPDVNYDLQEFRVTADATNLYFLARLVDITDTWRPYVSIAIDTTLDGTGQQWLGGNSGTQVSSSALWEREIVVNLNKTGYFTPGWAWTNAGSSYISAANDVIEISMPWSALGVALPKRLRFTVMIAQNAGGDTKDVYGANALDCITWISGNTWNEVSDTVIDYYFDVWFAANGNPFSPILISEISYYTVDDANREWIQVTNVSGGSLALAGFKLGDAETKNEAAEGMKAFPSGTVANGSSVVVARSGTGFAGLGYGCLANYEFTNTDGTPDMLPSSWGSGSVELDNAGDEVLLVDGRDTVVDALSWGSGTYPGTNAHGGAPLGESLERRSDLGLPDTNDATADFATSGGTPCSHPMSWVGNMSPAGGTTNTIVVPNSQTITVQVFKFGVTPGSGQGAGITCTLHWGTVGYFGGPWSNIADTSMAYGTDVGDNDQYQVTIAPGVGLYEFTAYCTDLNDGNYALWQGAGNGKLIVDTAGGDCNSANQTSNNLYWSGLGHNSFDTTYRSPFGAVPTSQGTLTLRFRTCMDNVTAPPQIRLYDDRTNGDTTTPMDFDGHGSDASLGGVTYWKTTVSVPTQATILYYVFQATSGTDEDWYRDDNPKFYGGGWGTGEDLPQPAYDNSFQVTVFDATFSTPAWLQNAVIYQVFPDRFRNGDTANDPAHGGDWIYDQEVRKLAWGEDLCDPRGSTCPNEYSNQFYGGDLQGLIDELDTLQELGVTAVYLNPIFEAPSNHLYDTQDYLTIDPYFGTLVTFQTLAAEAEARGIKLILDGVFNHVSSDSKYFDRYKRWDAAGNLTSPGGPGTNDLSGACEATSSAWRSWFFFQAGGSKCYDGTPGGLTMTYTDWAGYDSLPKLDGDLAAVRSYIYDGGSGSVARYWLAEGGDGWRFDVGGDVDEGTATGQSGGYWAGFRTAAHAQYADAALLGEEWGDASAWLVGDQWDSVMNYRFRSAVLSWLFDTCSGSGCTGGTKFEENDSNENSSSGPISYISPTELDLRLRSIREDYPAQAWQAMMNLMGSHDTNRVRFLLKKISGDNASTALTKWKLAGILAFTYPGAPTLYYGDEAGLAPDGVWDGVWSVWQDDPYNRAPYPWADEGRTPDTALEEHFRKLAVLRGQYPVLRTGDLTTLLTDDANKVYAYSRTAGTARLAVVVLNRDGAAHSVGVSGLDTAFDGRVLYDVMNCSGNPVTCASYTVGAGSIGGIAVASLWGAVLVEGPLPPYRVSLDVADDDLAAGASTAVTARVTDIGGQPVADGTPVTFARLSGGGSLSDTSATTTGGVAGVTYTAPGTGTTVAALRAAAGTYPAARDHNTVYTGFQADVSAESTDLLTIGPATLDAAAGTGVWAHKEGLGEPAVTASLFAGNPVGVPNPNVNQQSTAFVGLHLDTAAQVDEIEVRVDCNGTCNANTILWWFDAAAGKWKNWDVGLTGWSGNANGTVWGKVQSISTSPTYADLLQGIVIMGGDPSPTLVELASFAAAAQPGSIGVVWSTLSEVDTAGFNLWRSEAANGEYALLNAGLIQAKGGPTRPARYLFQDAAVADGVTYFYQLEAVDLEGQTQLFGPVHATAGMWHRIYLPAAGR